MQCFGMVHGGSGSEHSMATSQARDSAEHNEIASQSRAIKRRTQEEEAEPKVAAAKAEVAAAKAEVAEAEAKVVAARAEVAEAEAKVAAARAEVAEADTDENKRIYRSVITAYENANTNHQSACTVLQSACTVHQSATNKLAMLINETTTASSPFKKPRVSSSVLQECGTQQLQQSQAEGM
eukprot:Em0015g1299a